MIGATMLGEKMFGGRMLRRRTGGAATGAGRPRGRSPRSRRSRITAAAVGAALALAALAAPMASASAATGPDHAQGPKGTGKPLTVMTRNLYLGGDINRPINATAGLSGLEALLAFANTNDALWNTVVQTNFPVRARLLAHEIATEAPDVVGLQEVALWRHGPLELDKIAVPNAEIVDYDFLAILQSELAAAGAHYAVANVQQEADVEAPAFSGFLVNARDVRLTMRDALLVKVDPGLTVLASGGGNYDHRFSVSLQNYSFVFKRGYNWADLRVGSVTTRVVNTHLESASSDVALDQIKELIGGPADTSRPTVVVCDCNSDPLNHSVKPIDHVGHSAPYDWITSHGFTDEWLQFKPAEEGWTSGLSETVNDTSTAGFDHRIDMVFGRKAGGGGFDVDKGAITGNQLSDRDPTTGLWPSDHAGVVLRLRSLS